MVISYKNNLGRGSAPTQFLLIKIVLSCSSQERLTNLGYAA
jgi:hypothetical protein